MENPTTSDAPDAPETPAPPLARIPEPCHLGDGVYVSFDGYQIWLAVNDHRHKVIALDPGVMRRLDEWVAQLRKCGWG